MATSLNRVFARNILNTAVMTAASCWSLVSPALAAQQGAEKLVAAAKAN